MYIPSSFSNNKYGNWAFFKNKPEFKRFKFERMSFFVSDRATRFITVDGLCKGNGSGSGGGGGDVGGIHVARPTCYIL